MRTYVGNAFAINMLPCNRQHVYFEPLEAAQVAAALYNGAMSGTDLVSFFGHQDIAGIASHSLGESYPEIWRLVPPLCLNRVSVQLQLEDQMYICQYTGPRLPEGATTLPDGAAIQWWSVRITSRPERLERRVRELEEFVRQQGDELRRCWADTIVETVEGDDAFGGDAIA